MGRLEWFIVGLVLGFGPAFVAVFTLPGFRCLYGAP